MDPLAQQFECYRRAGDLQALAAVFDALAPRLLPVAMHLCGNPADAEDALQQTFLEAMDRGAAFDPARRLEPWLAGVLQNVVRNQRRREGRRRALPPLDAVGDEVSSEVGPLDVVQREELVTLLRTQVDALPAEQRQVLRLQLQHGLSPAAIAEALELPPGTVRMRLHRGIESLRRILPAGLAALLVVAFPARGLAAIKQCVLQAGALQAAACVAVGAKAAATGSATMVGGALVMKKLVVVFLLLLVAGVSWWIWAPAPGQSASASAAPTTPVEPAIAAAPEPTVAGAPSAASPERMAARAPDATGPRGPGPTELWGRVVDAATKAPVPGARIDLLHRPADEFWNLDLNYGEQAATLASAIGDVDGRFQFDVVRARSHRLRVRAAGYATHTLLFRCGGSESTIELARAAVVAGVVRCGQRLLADMQVRLAVRGESLELANGNTDGSGAFRFTDLPAANVYVQVSSPEFQEEWHDLDIVAGQQHDVTIEMQPGVAVRGRVLDAESGAPIAGAAIADGWTFERAVVSDREGRFTLAGLRRSEQYMGLHVRALGFTDWSQNVAADPSAEVEVRLQRGGSVLGRVVDVAGQVVPDAYVAVCASFASGPGIQGSDWRPARLSSDGRFAAAGLNPSHRYWLMVRAAAFGTRVHALPRALRSGEQHDVGDVVLRPGGSIEGVVVDESGAPHRGIDVSVRGTNADSLAWCGDDPPPDRVTQFEQRDVRTDENGVFRMAQLAAGRYRVEPQVLDAAPDTAIELHVADGELRDGVRVVVVRGLSVSGRLRRADGLPWSANVGTAWLRAMGGGAGIHEAVAGVDGSFSIPGMAPGTYQLSMLTAPKGLVLEPVQVEAGSSGVELVLVAARVVAGQVVDAQGRPTKAMVAASLPGAPASFRETDDEGRFEIEVAPGYHGTVMAMLSGPPRLRGQVEGVTAGQTGLRIELRGP